MFRGTTLLPAIRQALGMRNVHVRLLLLVLVLEFRSKRKLRCEISNGI